MPQREIIPTRQKVDNETIGRLRSMVCHFKAYSFEGNEYKVQVTSDDSGIIFSALSKNGFLHLNCLPDGTVIGVNPDLPAVLEFINGCEEASQERQISAELLQQMTEANRERMRSMTD